MAVPPLTMSVTVNPRDVARVQRRLDKWHGKLLADRTERATQAGIQLYVGPLRAAAPGPGNELPPRDTTGNLKASIGVRKLRLRSGEVAAYAVGARSNRPYKGFHRHLVIRGHRTASGSMTRAQPFVDEVHRHLEPQVTGFIDAQIRRLA